MKCKLCIMVLAAITALPLFADVVDDAVNLSQSGVTEEVIVAWSQRQHVGVLSAQDIIRLKNGKVPDRAIAAMIQQSGTAVETPRTSVNAEYVETPSTTTYVYDSPHYYSYGYPYYYSYGYPYYYGGYWGRPSFGLSFNFGGGHGGFRHRR